MSYSNRRTWNSINETFNGATTLAPTITFCPSQPVLIHKIGIRVTNTATGGIDTAVFTRNYAASSTAAIGTVVVTAASNNGSLVYKELSTPVEMLPGDYLTIIVTETGTAPTGIPVMEYSVRESKLADHSNTTASA